MHLYCKLRSDFLTQNILNPHCGYLTGCSTRLEGTGMLRVDKGQPIPLPCLPYPQPVTGFKTHDNHYAHRVPTCPNGFPDGATYVPLTEEMALEAMRKVAVASTYSPFSMPNTASTSRNVSNDFSFTRSNTPQSSSSFSAAYNNYTAP